MCPLARKVAPGVGRLHRERAFGGGHDQSLMRNEIGHLVGVGERAAQESRDEGEACADGQWLLGLPGDAVNVGVPVRA